MVSTAELIKLFNTDTKAFLSACDKEALGTPTEKANFFHKNYRNLDAEKLGEILGKPENNELLTAYLNKFIFSGQSLDTALSQFLSSFKLPGEAQVIDRFMVAFANKFYTENPIYLDASKKDDIYLLAFAVIMLNTNLDNPAVKDKMTKAQFVDQLTKKNRSGQAPTNLDAAQLGSLYDSIKAKPFIATP